MGNYSSKAKREKNETKASTPSLSPQFAKKQSDYKMNAPFIIKATAKHTASVIFLHGLGDTGQGWCEGFKDIQKPHIKYIFPTAPIRPVTLNCGMRMTAWFDIAGLAPGVSQDEDGLKQSREILLNLVNEELNQGIPSERIIIGGFSQGGATALYTTVTSPHKFGGVIALSTWLPLHDKLKEQMDKSGENLKTPILQCHGDMDPLVPEQWARLSGQMLQKLGFSDAKYKTYNGLMHSSCEEEMEDVANFIASNLK